MAKDSIKKASALRAGERLKATRDAKGLTVEELSLATEQKLSPSRISNYEQGTRQLPVEAAVWLGEALEVPAAYLLGLLDEIDRELLSFPIAVRESALDHLRTSRLYAQQETPTYGAKPPQQETPRRRMPAIHRVDQKRGKKNAG